MPNSVSTVAGKDEGRTIPAEKIAWLLFCFTCLQFVLMKYYVKVVGGSKADVFSGVLCAVTLAAALLAAKASPIRATIPEILISMFLLALAVLSGFTSTTPWSSSICAFVFAANCLGGFWCARILVNSRRRQDVFVWVCVGALAARLSLGLWGYYFHGLSQYFIEELHLIVGATLLLSFSPLVLLTRSNPLVVSSGLILLIGTFVELYVCGIGGVDSGVVVPMAMLIPAFIIVMARRGSKAPLLLALLIVAAVTTHFLYHLSTKTHSAPEYLSDRLDFYKFSVHVAEKHPFLGIGLRAPRTEFLADYKVWHPNLSERRFREFVSTLVVSQNIFLTFMVGFGVPFMILYLAAFGVLYIRLVRAAWRSPPDLPIPPMALLIPLTGSTLHFLTMDIMLMPQIAWFFHILLGLIPAPASAVQQAHRLSLKTVLSAVAGSVATVALGIFVGTHPALAPQSLPSLEEVEGYVKKIPVVRLFFEERKNPEVTEAISQGSLVINIQGYKAVPQKWSLLFLLDNSVSMAKTAEPWPSSRLVAAVAFSDTAARSLPEGCRVAARAFSDQGPIRKSGKEFPLRVSRLLVGWKDAPVNALLPSVSQEFTPGATNLCTALEFSLGRDFKGIRDDLSPRIAILTDGAGQCGLDGVIRSVSPGSQDRPISVVDLVAVGMSASDRELYLAALRGRGGNLIEIDRPDDLASATEQYTAVLGKPAFKPLVVRNEQTTHAVFPGQLIKLSAGTYNVTLPDTKGLVPGRKNQIEVEVKPGETSLINVSEKLGRTVVEKQQAKTPETE